MWVTDRLFSFSQKRVNRDLTNSVDARLLDFVSFDNLGWDVLFMRSDTIQMNSSLTRLSLKISLVEGGPSSVVSLVLMCVDST